MSTICKKKVFSAIRENQREANPFFRCFIPLHNDVVPENHFQLFFSTKAGGMECLKVQNVPYPFELFKVNDETGNRLIVEIMGKVELEDLLRYCDAICLVFGFVSGILPGEEICYQMPDGKEEYWQSTRASMMARYVPIQMNIKEKINPSCCLSGEDFGRLLSLVLKDINFTSILNLLMESVSICSPLLVPGIFAVIIESLSKIIRVDETGKVRPLEKQKLFREIKIKFYDLLAGYRDEFATEEDFIKFKRRIGELNKPVNMQFLTNTERLVRPFEILGIPLTMEDRTIIEHRNDLLHGSFYLSDESCTQPIVCPGYTEYISAGLYTLISALILKYTGYSGYIVNQTALQGGCKRENSSMEYYRWI